jgi:hypothetical protein
MRVGGGKQRVLSMPGGAVLLARVPAHRLEGAQAGVHGGTAMSVWPVLGACLGPERKLGHVSANLNLK